MDKNTLEFTVEQRHIDEGVCGRSGSCAIALALNDMGFKHVYVYVNVASIDGRLYDMSTEAISFMSRFDYRYRKDVKPERLTLELQR